jgi:hypothetical protein
MTHYLDAVRQGYNQWWRYLAAILFILIVWLILGSLPIIAASVVIALDDDPRTQLNPQTGAFEGLDPLWNFALLMVSFVLFFAGVALAVTLIHRRRFVSLITPDGAVNWVRVAQGFGAWFVLAAAVAVVEATLYPTRYQVTLDWARFVLFVPLALILIPIQTTSEELFFRGYVLQGAGLLTRNPIVLSGLSGVLFMLPHWGNPEVAADFWLLSLFYFGFGAFLAFVSLRDNGLELAIGVHAANNLFAGLFANYQGSALQTPSIFTVSVLDPVYNVVGALVAMVVFYAVFFRPQMRVARAIPG